MLSNCERYFKKKDLKSKICKTIIVEILKFSSNIVLLKLCYLIKIKINLKTYLL